MDLSTFGEFRAKAEAAGVVFYHSGEFNGSIVQAAADSLRSRLEELGTAGPAKRKLFSTFVEMAQNIVHYSAPELDGDGEPAPVKHGTISVGRTEDAHFWIVCVNRVETAHIPRLSEKLDAVRAMSLEEIKKAYKEQLHNTEHEQQDQVSRGAGLGWLTIARDSHQPLEYSFASDPLSRNGASAYFFVKAVI